MKIKSTYELAVINWVAEVASKPGIYPRPYGITHGSFIDCVRRMIYHKLFTNVEFNVPLPDHPKLNIKGMWTYFRNIECD